MTPLLLLLWQLGSPDNPSEQCVTIPVSSGNFQRSFAVIPRTFVLAAPLSDDGATPGVDDQVIPVNSGDPVWVHELACMTPRRNR